jgi:hypothetical protein
VDDAGELRAEVAKLTVQVATLTELLIEAKTGGVAQAT